MEKLQALVIFFLSLIICSCGNNSNHSGFNDSVVEEEEEIEKWEDCENCNGRGYFIHTCGTCEGSGRLTSSYTRKDTRTCESCYGTGIAPCNSCGNRGYHRCSSCDLTGKVRCEACNGSGRLAHNIGGDVIISECGMCDGSGYRTCLNCGGKNRITCNVCYGEGHLRCPTCHGTGGPDYTYSETNDEGECPNCSGSGKTKERCDECDGEGKIKIE